MKMNIQHTLNEVTNLLAEISVPVRGLASKHSIFLSTRQELESLSGQRGCIGLAYTTKSPLTARSQQSRILLLDTLVRPKLESTLAHELFHIYSSHNGLTINKLEEEGSAELAAFYVYQRIGEIAKTSLHISMHLRENDVYGDGFRHVFNLAQKAGGIKHYFERLVPSPIDVPTKFLKPNIEDMLWPTHDTTINSTPTREWWKSEQTILGMTKNKWWHY